MALMQERTRKNYIIELQTIEKYKTIDVDYVFGNNSYILSFLQNMHIYINI